jgi:Putative sensor
VPQAGSGTAGSSAEPRRLPGLAAVPYAVVSARTWLALVHLFAGLPVGIVGFVLVVTGLAAGTATLAVFLLGLGVYAAMFWLVGLIARLEQARFALLLGVDIPAAPLPPEPVWWRRLLRPMRSAAAWRQVCYAVIRFPLSLVQVILLSVAWSLGPALMALPLYNSALPGGGAHLDGYFAHGAGPMAVSVLAGLLLLLAAPQVTRGLAIMDAALGRPGRPDRPDRRAGDQPGPGDGRGRGGAQAHRAGPARRRAAAAGVAGDGAGPGQGEVLRRPRGGRGHCRPGP